MKLTLRGLDHDQISGLDITVPSPFIEFYLVSIKRPFDISFRFPECLPGQVELLIYPGIFVIRDVFGQHRAKRVVSMPEVGHEEGGESSGTRACRINNGLEFRNF